MEGKREEDLCNYYITNIRQIFLNIQIILIY